MQNKHLFIVMGSAGCGKSTIGRYLAKTTNWPYLEGDDRHSEANKEKMKTQPLTDQDRYTWLATIAADSIRELESHDVVITSCSALKVKYRDQIRRAVTNANEFQGRDYHINITFLHLNMTEDLAVRLVADRQKTEGHFMPASQVHGQFQVLERKIDWEDDMCVLDTHLGILAVESEALRLVKISVAGDEEESARL